MEVKVSVDKIIIAYIGISLELFNTYIAKNLCDFYHTTVKPNDSKAFHYTVYLPENNGHYLHLSYKLLSEPKSLRYTLDIQPKGTVLFDRIYNQKGRFFLTKLDKLDILN